MYNKIQKVKSKTNKFLLLSWRSLTKIAGSRAGFESVSTDPRIRIRTKMSRIRNTEFRIEVDLLLVVRQSPAPVDLAAKMAAIYNELSVKVCNMQIKATIMREM